MLKGTDNLKKYLTPVIMIVILITMANSLVPLLVSQWMNFIELAFGTSTYMTIITLFSLSMIGLLVIRTLINFARDS